MLFRSGGAYETKMISIRQKTTSAIDKMTHHFIDVGTIILHYKSSINVLNACHFTYSPNEQHFRKSLIISFRVNALQLNFLELYTVIVIVVSRKFKLKLRSANFCSV